MLNWGKEAAPGNFSWHVHYPSDRLGFVPKYCKYAALENPDGDFGHADGA